MQETVFRVKQERVFSATDLGVLGEEVGSDDCHDAAAGGGMGAMIGGGMGAAVRGRIGAVAAGAGRESRRRLSSVWSSRSRALSTVAELTATATFDTLGV